MKKLLLIPDSFKRHNVFHGNLLHYGRKPYTITIRKQKLISIPVADGGEGSVDAFLEALGGEKVSVKAQDPYGREINSFYGILPDGTAVLNGSSCRAAAGR